MGNQAVVSVLSDACHEIENDPNFGRSLVQAMMNRASLGSRPENDRLRCTVGAHATGGGIHCNAAEVISFAHSDYSQIVVCHGNTGWRAGYGEEVPDRVERALVEEVKRLGYRVSKKTRSAA